MTSSGVFLPPRAGSGTPSPHSSTPARPAVSPLTEPAPRTREPSAAANLDDPQLMAEPYSGAPGGSHEVNANASRASATNHHTIAMAAAAFPSQTRPFAANLATPANIANPNPAPKPKMVWADQSERRLVSEEDWEEFRAMGINYLPFKTKRPEQHPPYMPTVRPADITNPGPDPLANASFGPPGPLSAPASAVNHASNEAEAVSHTPRDSIDCYAYLEFVDSIFLMTTYAVIIGRDRAAVKQAKLYNKRALPGLRPERRPLPEFKADPKYGAACYSKEGGLLGPTAPDDGSNANDSSSRPAKKRKLESTGSASDGASRSDSMSQLQRPQQPQQPLEASVPGIEQGPAKQDHDDGGTLIATRQWVSYTPGSLATDLGGLPSPDCVAFLGIHSPMPATADNARGISRRHMKIEFNQKRHVFEAFALHGNGFFCDEVHHKESCVLRSGCQLQIKDVVFIFTICGVPIGETGALEDTDLDQALDPTRRYSEGGKEMSLDINASKQSAFSPTSDSSCSGSAVVETLDVAMPDASGQWSSDSELSDVPADETELVQRQNDPHKVWETIESGPNGNANKETQGDGTAGSEGTSPGAAPKPAQEVPTKRRAGRPPKNGIMSKREERERRKKAQEEARANMPPPPPEAPPVKRSVGRPRKHPLPEGEKPEKRKYKPRKKPGDEGADSCEAEKAIKKSKTRRHKTPPVTLRKEDFTAEQLQKPNKNYGMLIDEVLTASAPDGLSLKQIYKRIVLKYPYFHFQDTKGWESSVRHNLTGNLSFTKSGETHLWSRVLGIDLEAGKKRKAGSPDQGPDAEAFQDAAAPTLQPPSGHHHLAESNQPRFQGHLQPLYMYQHPWVIHPHAGSSGQGLALTESGHQAEPAPGPGLVPQPPARTLNGLAVAMPGTPAPRPSLTVPGAGLPPLLPQAGINAQASMYQQQLLGSAPHLPYTTADLRPSQPSFAAAAAVAPALGATPHSILHQHQQGRPRHPTAQPGPGAMAANGGPPQAFAPLAMAESRPPQPPQPPQQAVPATRVGHDPNPTPEAEPPISSELVRNVKSFINMTILAVADRTHAAESIAISVVNRVLGLTDHSIAPLDEDEVIGSLERSVKGVFEESLNSLHESQRTIRPDVLNILVGFKNNMIRTLEDRLGPLRSERLILSAVNRTLGFTDKSTMCLPRNTSAEDRAEYDHAEMAMMPPIAKAIANQQTQPVAGAGLNMGGN